MKLSQLTYEAVKNVVYLDDEGFTYEAFLDKDFNNDQDYSNQINNAMEPINEAIHRLSDRNKIKFKIAGVGKPANNLIDISAFHKNAKKIKAVFYLTDAGYRSIAFREFDANHLFIESVLPAPLFIQFIEDIKPFKMSDIYDEEKDIDLLDVGITDTACSYIIEYVQGKLLEPIDPNLANLHITRSEQYFDDLEQQNIVFTQRVVTAKFRI